MDLLYSRHSLSKLMPFARHGDLMDTKGSLGLGSEKDDFDLKSLRLK